MFFVKRLGLNFMWLRRDGRGEVVEFGLKVRASGKLVEGIVIELFSKRFELDQ